jgi:hypothetical protein
MASFDLKLSGRRKKGRKGWAFAFYRWSNPFSSWRSPINANPLHLSSKRWSRYVLSQLLWGEDQWWNSTGVFADCGIRFVSCCREHSLANSPTATVAQPLHYLFFLLLITPDQRLIAVLPITDAAPPLNGMGCSPFRQWTRLDKVALLRGFLLFQWLCICMDRSPLWEWFTTWSGSFEAEAYICSYICSTPSHWSLVTLFLTAAILFANISLPSLKLHTITFILFFFFFFFFFF